ncbi:MAG: 2-oxoacid:acceptor oxidoreductase subunit alpha [Candidatus Moranbacteria bacterium]|nr:2-oxoacid:acceptor oxidoreductase subunit alpha [Candidatus Moranbacteria bacterium]
MSHFSKDISIVVGGAAGQGIQTVEAALMRILKDAGYGVFACKEYMSRVRGGSNSVEIRLSSTKAPRRAYVRRIDFLFALDAPALCHLKWRIGEGTTVFAEKAGADSDGIRRFIDTPIVRFANEAGGSPLYANSVALGVVLGVLGVSSEGAEAFLRKTFSRKGEDVVEKNVAALRKGYDFGRHTAYAEGIEVPLTPDEEKKDDLLLDGTTALGIGALAGGCDFISSYPMSPGTGVLAFLAQHAKRCGVVVDQAEDEISAINAGLGASYAGARALVTTSGGGFDLMQEGVSLSGMIETPIVIHIGQRPGPATGLPTRTEQGDLNLALYAGHGEFVRAIYAPGTPAEAIETMQKAFDTADAYQIPVFVLSDQYFLDAVSPLDAGDVPRMQITKHVVKSENSYHRYALSKDGLSPRAVPGHGDGLVCVDSDEHDESGHITESFDVRKAMMEKRFRRLDALRDDAMMPKSFDNFEESETAVISWGSNKGVLEEVIGKLGSKTLGGLHFAQVFPINPDVKKLLKGKRIVVVENNHSGQFADLLVRELGVKVSRRVLKSTGEPFAVEELIEELKSELTTNN